MRRMGRNRLHHQAPPDLPRWCGQSVTESSSEVGWFIPPSLDPVRYLRKSGTSRSSELGSSSKVTWRGHRFATRRWEVLDWRPGGGLGRTGASRLLPRRRAVHRRNRRRSPSPGPRRQGVVDDRTEDDVGLGMRGVSEPSWPPRGSPNRPRSLPPEMDRSTPWRPRCWPPATDSR